MTQNQWGLYAIAVTIAVVGALAFGVPVGTWRSWAWRWPAR